MCFVFVMATFVLLSRSLVVAASERQDADVLEKLEAEVRLILPADWVVAISPADDEHRGTYGDAPRITIRTKQKVLALEHIINGSGEEKPENQFIEIELVVRPSMTPAAYAEAEKINRASTQKRLDFARKLKGIKWGFMGGEPRPPWAYKPKSDAEKRLVREYQFVWLNTQPQKLPTHYYGDLSFVRWFVELEIKDEAKAKELRQINAALDRILKAYYVNP